MCCCVVFISDCPIGAVEQLLLMNDCAIFCGIKRVVSFHTSSTKALTQKNTIFSNRFLVKLHFEAFVPNAMNILNVHTSPDTCIVNDGKSPSYS